MASSADEQGLPEIKSVGKPSVLDGFVELIPKIYYGINKVFEESTSPGFTKKEGMVLWALHASTQKDPAGTYLTIAELTAMFSNWFVVSDKSAGAEVSKAKASLLKEDYVMVAGAPDHIHLTPWKGVAASEEIRRKAKEILSATLKNISAENREKLLEIAEELITAQRRPPQKEIQVAFDFEASA